MKVIIFLLYIFISIFQVNAQESIFKDKLFMESGRELINIGKRLSKGDTVTSKEWECLFSTEGYNEYLTMQNGTLFKDMIKEAVIVAFSPDRVDEAEENSKLELDLNSPEMPRILITQNMYRLSKRLDTAEKFLDDTDFVALLDKAHERTKQFLPPEAYKEIPELNDLYIIGSVPDASVRNKSVFIDLNLMLELSEEEFINLMAHEFHHNYRDLIIPGRFEDPLLNMINSIHAEGVADLIDKKGVPFTHLSLYGEDLSRAYTQDFLDTPGTLKVIDSTVCAYLAGEVSYEDYLKLGNKTMFGDHTNGFYMTLLIKERGYMHEMLNSYADPVAFIKLYNRAAKESAEEYILSDTLISYFEELWEEYLNR